MKSNATCHIGTSGWSYGNWDQKFYPSEIPKTKWFNFYTENFHTVEMNATFYRGFKEKTFKKWYEEAPDGFQYVFKANRIITHRKYLKNVSESVKRFCDSVNLVKEKLGLILLQLHPNTSFDLKLLEDALESFDDPSMVAVEFRNEQWFHEDTYQLLRKTGSIFCNIDSPKFKIHDVVTAKKAYFRFHGKKEWYKHHYTDKELHEIALTMDNIAEKGVSEMYAFFNNDVDANAPVNARRLKEIIDKNSKNITIK